MLMYISGKLYNRRQTAEQFLKSQEPNVIIIVNDKLFVNCQ